MQVAKFKDGHHMEGTIIHLSSHDVYKPAYAAHANNSHCLAQAVNTLFAALFTYCGRAQDIEERLKEFLALASSSLLRLGRENDKDVIKNRDATYILLHQESRVMVTIVTFKLVRESISKVKKNYNKRRPTEMPGLYKDKSVSQSQRISVLKLSFKS
ncbi:Membrane-associated protein Hem [Portunus trituberculatus]|uniref:Membrane-associated protein Hem n=1 Tax=Portunus trituberculatus TaxID=210409 RepID=A0A5B7H5I8_PORTR|nr:Membrane-associated protein Hem [Portunus trituberculatus]